MELEQRALLLKRLAFVIYCSNEDQYQKQVPDIQGTFMLMLRWLRIAKCINLLLMTISTFSLYINFQKDWLRVYEQYQALQLCKAQCFYVFE